MKKVLLTEREYQALSKLRHDNERGLNESANDITSFIKRGLKSVRYFNRSLLGLKYINFIYDY